MVVITMCKKTTATITLRTVLCGILTSSHCCLSERGREGEERRIEEEGRERERGRRKER